MSIPRNDYPRPQWRRDDWLCLNGDWQFERDPADTGLERGLVQRELAQRIVVPFCPESPLSGIDNPDHHLAVWYRRQVAVPADWRGRRVLLHFQAVDEDCTAWIDGQEIGRHEGGTTPFAFDITDHIAPGGEGTLVVRARDDHRQDKPKGKQSARFANKGCHYCRTTGIWQTVWLEAVAPMHLRRGHIQASLAGGHVVCDLPLSERRSGYRVTAELIADGQVVASAASSSDGLCTPRLILAIDAADQRAWSPADPFLYDLHITLRDAADVVVDAVQSYTGLRDVGCDGHRFLLNGRPIFQRLVLDQGYYPDGILTAPSDEALIEDIRLAQAAGFNGARLHQKVFEERFLYHADRLGYLVWGEYGDWFMDDIGKRPRDWVPRTLLGEWLRVVERDRSHPSIIGWCPLNESWVRHGDTPDAFAVLTRAVLDATHATDPSRPVMDVSGWTHCARGDCFDIHAYEVDATVFADRIVRTLAGDNSAVHFPQQAGIPYDPEHPVPFFVSEFGGILWNDAIAASDPHRSQAWGYGDMPATREAFFERFTPQIDACLDHPQVAGYCYTQLTDVYQEQNGLFTFDRKPKFDCAQLHAIQSRPAAIEEARQDQGEPPQVSK